MRRVLALAVAILLGANLFGAGAGLAQTPAPSPKPPRTPKAKAPAPSKPMLDFTGVWVLDAEASTGVAPQMENVVLRVRQNGNRIWIEQIESNARMVLSEQIVVDGQKYEKGLGAGQKGTLEAAWGNDGTSLWLQAIAATEANPTAAVQRMVWRLRDGGKTWTRQTMTIQPDGTKETFLIFRKREAGKK
jgi:hypothetical protein